MSGQSEGRPDPAPLLRKHMLGIVCYTNDKLQDVHGKQSILSKTQIIRGLGAFIRHIGDAVHTVAPQVVPHPNSRILYSKYIDHGHTADNVYDTRAL